MTFREVVQAISGFHDHFLDIKNALYITGRMTNQTGQGIMFTENNERKGPRR